MSKPPKVPEQTTKKERAIEQQALYHAFTAAKEYLEENDLFDTSMINFTPEQIDGLIEAIGREYSREMSNYFWLFANGGKEHGRPEKEDRR